MSSPRYIGEELRFFAEARNWKAYFKDFVSPHLGTHVLEVGAGLGATTQVLAPGDRKEWLCLEPDADLEKEIVKRIASGELPPFCRSCNGTLQQLPQGRFDTVLYMDVLEHIQDAAGEIREAVSRLSPGGRLIVLSPAWQCLYSPFDRAIGHHRRYNRSSLRAVMPEGLKEVMVRYLDSVGLIASLGNALFLRQTMPSLGQVLAWDRYMVPLSRWIDPLLGFRLGKSLLGVWKT